MSSVTIPNPEKVSGSTTERLHNAHGWVEGVLDGYVEITASVAKKVFTDALSGGEMTIPAGSKVEAFRLTCMTAGTITTGTALGIGKTDDPDQLSETTFTSIDAVNDTVADLSPSNVEFAAAAAIYAHSTNGSGSAAGTLDTGKWAIRIFYRTLATHVSFA